MSGEPENKEPKMQNAELKIKNRTLLFRILFFLLTILSFSSFAQKSSKLETINGKKYYIHTVEKEQTLYNISKIYGVTVNDIVIENPEAIDGIKPGQSLKIPYVAPKVIAKPASKADSTKYIFHNVEKGQTMFSLTRQYNVTTEVLLAENPELKDGLKAGQVIKIPRTEKEMKKEAKKEEPKEKEVKKEKEKEKMVEIMKTPTLSAVAKNISPLLNTELFVDTTKAQKKNIYTVALLLPFNSINTINIDADKIAKGDTSFPQVTEIAIEFYQGVLLALDSLKNKGFSCKLLVYDIDKGDSTKLADILAGNDMKEADLIIGPLHTSRFVQAAKFARDRNIHCISPLAQENKILFENPYVSKTVPTLTNQLEQMADHITGRYGDQNLILITTPTKDFGIIKSRINKTMKIKFDKDSVPETETSAGAIAKLVHGKTNVVIYPSNNEAKVNDFITKLQDEKSKYTIFLFGIPYWRNFSTLDQEYLDTLHYHFPSATYIDYDSPVTKRFILQYREKYSADPELYVYQGFDVGMFYFSELYNNGVNFSGKLSGANAKGLQSNFSFYRPDANSGCDNKAVFILRYLDYKLVKAE